MARTLNTCPPGLTLKLFGEVQFLNGFVSTLHLKVEPASEETNLKVTLLAVVVFPGFLVIVVSGAVASTVNERLAGVWSVLPTRSMARTRKV